MPKNKSIYVLGYASGMAAADPGCADGPVVLQKSSYMDALRKEGLELHWEALLKPDPTNKSKSNVVQTLCKSLAEKIARLVQEKKFFVVLGGDHSSAMGTWNGISVLQKPVGLIWIDAHMDSHTPETSHSKNIHGMPLACLLGYVPELTKLFSTQWKLQPQHLCLIGVRSYEPEEKKFLEKLNVRIFYMNEVKERGLSDVMKEALTIVTKGTCGFGVSLDIDGIDPKEAPGTGVAEPNGLSAREVCNALVLVSQQPQLLGIEIAEFDPHSDQDNRTEKLIPQLIKAVTKGVS